MLARDIADARRQLHPLHPDRHRAGRGASAPGAFRTSIICAPQRDRPGALLSILQEFALRAVNLTKLESRPTKTGLGRYMFFIDIEGSRDRDLPVASAIQALEEQGATRVTFLGSYRAAGGPG